MTTGMSNSNRNRSVISAAVQSIDSVSGEASCFSRKSGMITVDFSHYVGAVAVTPVIGEQWFVELVEGGIYYPRSRIPFNDPNQISTTPTQGQHVVGGGNGPVTVSTGGALVNIGGPLNTQSVATSARPAATSVPPGTQIYDVTVGKPIWSDGTVWHDAAGTTV